MLAITALVTCNGEKTRIVLVFACGGGVSNRKLGLALASSLGTDASPATSCRLVVVTGLLSAGTAVLAAVLVVVGVPSA